MGAELNVLIVSRTFSCSSASWESTVRMPSGPKSTATLPPAASGWFVSRVPPEAHSMEANVGSISALTASISSHLINGILRKWDELLIEYPKPPEPPDLPLSRHDSRSILPF